MGGHHHHAHDSREVLRRIGDVSEANKRQVSSKYTDLRITEALSCTNHGITVGAATKGVPAFKCMLAFVLMHVAMPSGSSSLLQGAAGNWGAAAVHLLATALPGFVVVHHDKYHAAGSEVIK